MDWFVVKYRKPDGTMTEAEFEAADKSALFKLLAEKKISAISIHTGKAKKKKDATAPKTKTVCCITFGTIVVLGAVLVFYFISRDTTKKPLASEDQPNVARDVRRVETPAKTEKELLAEKKADAIIKSVAESIETAQRNQASETNQVNDIGIEASKRAKELGVTAVDQLLNMATTSPTDIPPPPLPITSRMEDDFREMLKKPIEIKNTDSEDVRIIKEKMLKNRAEMLALLDEGYTIHDVLTKHQETLTDHANLRRTVMEGLKEYEDEGDTDGAEAYLKVMNAKLEEMGVEPVYGSNPLRDRQAKRLKQSN